MFAKIPKTPRSQIIVSHCSLRKHYKNIVVVGKPIIDSLTVIHKWSYVCAIVENPCAKICFHKTDVSECPHRFSSVFAATEHRHAIRVSIVYNERLLQI